MIQPFRLIACICVAAFSAPLAAGAQTAPVHVAPKVQKHGANTIATMLAEIRAGKYDQAKSDLGTYLQTNPNDTQAYMLLGVANAFGGDSAAASAAFAKAGTIPEQYRMLALQSYEKYANAALGDKNYSGAIDAANAAIALNPQSLQGYYVRGQANLGTQNYTTAIADLQKAHAIAVTAKSDDQSMATLAFTLAVAQLDAGQFGEAAQTAKDLYRNNTNRSGQLDKFAYAAVMNAAIALANAGRIADSVSRLESGATAFPNDAGALTAEAAYILASDKKPDWDKVTAEAQKALDLDPNAGKADFVLGVAASEKNDPKSAVNYMNKAKATPAYQSDASLARQINDALTKLNGTTKP